jgi:5,10-methenyltetrahydrofolate synthetase
VLGLRGSSTFLYTGFMQENSMLKELKNVVAGRQECILYKPLRWEVDYRSPVFPFQIANTNIVLPGNSEADPFLWASKCLELFKEVDPYILIPGSQFDIHGTRKGRGGGWYDRFLSKIPREWLRIGITHASNLSTEPITKNPWDEPVDWVIAQDGSSSNFHYIKTGSQQSGSNR